MHSHTEIFELDTHLSLTNSKIIVAKYWFVVLISSCPWDKYLFYFTAQGVHNNS